MEEEIKLAKKMREKAIATTSNYLVGAVLKTKEGKIYTGCNIENDGIQSICAERVAFCKALSEGERNFEHIIVVGAKREAEKLEKCLPCGYCRQFISEFTNKDFKIYTAYDEKIEEYTIEELLPHNFNL